MIRLLALDVDGTLVGEDLTISPRVRTAIANAQAQGITGCLVTGRMFRAAVPFARQLNFSAPLICYQGAAIIDPGSDQVLLSRPLAPEVVQSIIEVALTDGVHLQLYANDQYYVEQENEHSALYARLSQVAPVTVPSLRTMFAATPATKAVIIDTPERAHGYLPRLHAALGASVYITRSYPQFIELLDPSVDKGVALAFVAQRLGIAHGEIAAIGDSWNDAPLFRAAGAGYAMGSAPPELIALATAVVGDVAHDGVAQAIETYVLR